jgi:hypothetical protein
MKRLLFCLGIISLLNVDLIAQEVSVAPIVKKINKTVLIGLPLTLNQLPRFAFNVGLNADYRIAKHLSAEAQLSYTAVNFCREDGGLFVHDGGSLQYVNVLVGPRLYLSKETKTNRLYINALLGYGMEKNREYYNSNTLIDFKAAHSPSLALGMYLQVRKKLVFGATVEGPVGHFVFKAGYQF